MNAITKEQLIEDLKASTQNSSGMFEISEDTICALMSMLTNAAQQLPQQSVPDDVLKRIEHEANHVTDFHHIDEHSCKVNRRDLLTMVNACRAAMLQGAKQWIPCSERMPEEEQGSVIGWNAETCEAGEYFYDNDEVECFSYYNFCGYHSFNADVVTHWMPLPSSPQKEAVNG